MGSFLWNGKKWLFWQTNGFNFWWRWWGWWYRITIMILVLMMKMEMNIHLCLIVVLYTCKGREGGCLSPQKDLSPSWNASHQPMSFWLCLALQQCSYLCQCLCQSVKCHGCNLDFTHYEKGPTSCKVHTFTLWLREKGLSCGMSESDSQTDCVLEILNVVISYCNICMDGHDGESYVQILWCVWPFILLNLL